MTTSASVLMILGFLSASSFGADDAKKSPTRAPADFVLLEANRTGAFFIARPLREKYDALLHQLASLRTEIAEARIDSAEARRRVERLQSDLDALRKQIDAGKIHIPGATTHLATETKTFPFPGNDLLLIDAGNVEIRGWDRQEIKCVLEKLVLGEKDQDVTGDLEGIQLVHRMTSGKDTFGFYQEGNPLAKQDDWKAELERFPFKEFLKKEFPLISVKGLSHEEGNRSINVEMLNDAGNGIVGSEMRRHAKLTVFVPRCRQVGVRGALGGLKVQGLDAAVAVAGEGNRDYHSVYELSDLNGGLTAVDIPIHRLDGIRGDVSVTATSFAEDVGTAHGGGSISMRSGAPTDSTYRDIQGELHARFCRADLSLDRIGGRIDVENDFGPTLLVLDQPLAARDHRIVSQSGAIEVRLGPQGAGDLGLNVFTECGTVHLAGGQNKPPGPGERGFQVVIPGVEGVGLVQLMGHSFEKDTVRRGWNGYYRKPSGEQVPGAQFEVFKRMAAALNGRKRTPGLDVISRSGSVLVAGKVEQSGR
jgi:hypothetical protein